MVLELPTFVNICKIHSVTDWSIILHSIDLYKIQVLYLRTNLYLITFSHIPLIKYSQTRCTFDDDFSENQTLHFQLSTSMNLFIRFYHGCSCVLCRKHPWNLMGDKNLIQFSMAAIHESMSVCWWLLFKNDFSSSCGGRR